MNTTMNKTLAHTIQQEFNNMLDRGRIPVMEYEMRDGDYLVIDIHTSAKGVHFNLSEDFTTAFSNEVLRDGYNYYIPYDGYTDTLDAYLELIDQEIVEGVLIPNDLLPL